MNATDILTLTQWLSPSYPVGSFSYSHGLETAIADQRIVTANDLQNWLTSIIEHGSGWNDLVLLCSAYRAKTPQELALVSELAKALCPSQERLAETLQQGAAFARTTQAIWGGTHATHPYPIAIGVAASLQKIELETTCYLYIHSFVANLVSAAVRLVPLGQTDGQDCLHRLTPICVQTVQSALLATLEDVGTCTFASDITAMNHETEPVRIFQS